MVDGTKYFVQGNNFRFPEFKFYQLIDLADLTSLRLEKENSKKPFSSEVTPHFPMEVQKLSKLGSKITTVRGVDSFGQTILPCKLCLHAPRPSKYGCQRVGRLRLSHYPIPHPKLASKPNPKIKCCSGGKIKITPTLVGFGFFHPNPQQNT